MRWIIPLAGALVACSNLDQLGVCGARIGSGGSCDAGAEPDAGASSGSGPVPDAGCEPVRVARTLKVLPPPGGAGQFGTSVAAIGDYDGDGIGDLAIGAPFAQVGSAAGAVWIATMGRGGTVRDMEAIEALAGPSQFGLHVAALGPIPSSTVGRRIAVASELGGGAVWIVDLKRTGGRLEAIERGAITNTDPCFRLRAGWTDRFGSSIAPLGDLNGDGFADLAVGAYFTDAHAGAVWLLFLDGDASVRSCQRISARDAVFSGELMADDQLGSAAVLLSIAGRPALALGSNQSHDREGEIVTSAFQGAVWTVPLASEQTTTASVTPASSTRIPQHRTALADALGAGASFGVHLEAPGDLDGDGNPDLLAGSIGYQRHRGATWALFLDRGGALRSFLRLTDETPEVGDELGAIAWLGRYDGGATSWLAVGATLDKEAGAQAGAVHLLELETQRCR